MAITNRLTAKEVLALKPREADYTVADGEGLYLLIKPSGVKLWRQKYVLHDKPGLLSHGEYGNAPKVGLADARRLKDQALLLIAKGEKPQSERQRVRESAKAQVIKEAQAAELNALSQSTTFEAIGREWLGLKSTGLKPVTIKKITLICEQSIFPSIGALQIAQITGAQVGAMLKAIEARGALEIAKRAQQFASSIFKLAMQDDRAAADRAAPFKGSIKQRAVTHNPTITPDGLGDLINAIRAYHGEPLVRFALEFVLQTASRTAETIGATWHEIDFERATWNIPASRMKMKKSHSVPLSGRAIELLLQARQHCGASELVFPGRAGRMSNNTLLFALYRCGYHTRASVHGFRSVFSTVMNELDRRHDVVERALAHGDPDKIRGTYNKAEYRQARILLAHEWSLILELSAQGMPWDKIRRASESGQTLESLHFDKT